MALVAESTRHGRAVSRHIAAVAVLVACATACGTATTPPSAPLKATSPPVSPNPADADLLAGITVTPSALLAASADDNALSVDLLQQLELTKPNSNLVDSAYSVATALAMLDLGARGDTQTQIAAVLHAAGVSAELQAAALRQLDAALLATAQGDGIALDVANAVWLQQGLPVEASFLNTLMKDFAAPSSVVDFNADPQGAAATVNRWVSATTHGEIPSVVSATDVQTVKLLLADAVYFDAHWQDQFPPSSTSPAPFFRLDSSQVSTAFMQSNLEMLSVETGGGVTAVELPYVGGHFVADVIMPTSEPIGTFVAGLTPSSLTGIEQRLATTQNVVLSLPKFDVSSQESLVPMLQALGMKAAFTGGEADLSGIDGRRDLSVGLAEQRALIHVDEVGTTAAAATIVGGIGAAGPQEPITQITINHPFLFVIRDTMSGAIIFTAQVVDPTATS